MSPRKLIQPGQLQHEIDDIQQHRARTAQAPAAQLARLRRAGACAVRAPVSPTEYLLDSSRKNVAGSYTISKIESNSPNK